MMRMKRLKYVPALLMTLAVGVTAMNGCSSVNDALKAANEGCDGLDARASIANANVLAFATASAGLKVKADEAQTKFKDACNGMLKSLGLPERDTANLACADVKARVDSARAAGVTVVVDVEASCKADVNVRASCEADCNVAATCDVTAKCDPGQLVVSCQGTCSGSCDVQAPSVACEGKCEGSCTADVAAVCTGTCEGTCEAPSFEGTCDVGCEAGFVGSCEGHCDGTCDGAASTGDGAAQANCAGKCEGKCTGKATGTCTAKCNGVYKGPKCMGVCKGSCAATAAIDCKGTCNGKCTYNPGKADCKGECHGGCTGTATAPRCEGSVDCTGSAECKGSCDGEAKATVNCNEPTVHVTVVGDLALQKAIEANLELWGEAFNLTYALKDPIYNLAGAGGNAVGGIVTAGVGGAACFSSSLKLAGEAKVSIDVSVSASASLNANAQ